MRFCSGVSPVGAAFAGAVGTAGDPVVAGTVTVVGVVLAKTFCKLATKSCMKFRFARIVICSFLSSFNSRNFTAFSSMIWKISADPYS